MRRDWFRVNGVGEHERSRFYKVPIRGNGESGYV